MNAISFLACSVALWAYTSRSKSVLRSFLVHSCPPAWLALPAAVSLIPLYAAQLALGSIDSRLQSAASPYAWMKTLPIKVFDDRLAHHGWLANAYLALGVLETLAIGLVVLRFRHVKRALRAGGIVAIAAGLILLSITSPVMSTTDPYEYAATGIIGMEAYAPPNGAFDRTAYEPYRKLVPVKGVIYGPLWVAVDIAQTSIGSSIGQKIEAIRITNVAFVGILVALLWLARLPRAAIVGISINPALWYYSVANPHAEIQGLALLAVAYAFARRSKSWLAVTFVVAAGLIKLPFVIVGAAVFSPLPGTPRRLSAWLAAILLVVVLSYVVPGPTYLAGLFKFGVHRATGASHVGWIAVAFLIAGASCALLAFRRTSFGAAWLFQQLSPLVAPWYLFWGIPYAVATGSLEAYAISLPLASSILDEVTRHEDGFAIAVIIVITTLIADIFVTARSARAAVALT